MYTYIFIFFFPLTLTKRHKSHNEIQIYKHLFFIFNGVEKKKKMEYVVKKRRRKKNCLRYNVYGTTSRASKFENCFRPCFEIGTTRRRLL